MVLVHCSGQTVERNCFDNPICFSLRHLHTMKKKDCRCNDMAVGDEASVYSRPETGAGVLFV